MKELLVKLLKNKKNGQINLSIPKKQLDCDTRKALEKSKSAIIKLEKLNW